MSQELREYGPNNRLDRIRDTIIQEQRFAGVTNDICLR